MFWLYPEQWHCRRSLLFCIIISFGLVFVPTSVLFFNSAFLNIYELSSSSVELGVFSTKHFFHPQRFRFRRKVLHNMCKTLALPLPSNINMVYSRIYVSERYKLLFCGIPKVASTNWLKVFAVLNNQTAAKLPSNIKGSQVGMLNLTRLSMYSPFEQNVKLSNYTKFLFLRHPFKRLLSAFLNKFRNPDNAYFPKVYGRKIFEKLGKKLPSPKTVLYWPAPSFQDFLHYILYAHIELPYMNSHWEPQYLLCAPCFINYDLIGKLETFEEDVKYIMEFSGANRVTQFPRRKYPHPPISTQVLKQGFKNVSGRILRRIWNIYLPDMLLFNYSLPNFFQFS